MKYITFYLLDENDNETIFDIKWEFDYLPQKNQFIYDDYHLFLVKGVHYDTKTLNVTIATVECKMGGFDDIDIPYELN